MGESRKEQVLIRLNRKEKMHLEVLAEIEGKTITDYVRDLINESYQKRFSVGYFEITKTKSEEKVLTEEEENEKYGITVWTNPAFSGIDRNRPDSVFPCFELASS